MQRLNDIDFQNFDWTLGLDADLAMISRGKSFRALIHRWLLTEPAQDPVGITSEEIERRQLHVDSPARRSGYAAPSGTRLTACFPGDPSWGAGIKRYLSAPMTDATLAEVRNLIRDGLARLDGVIPRPAPDVDCSVSGRTLTVLWKINTETGIVSDETEIGL